jgi:large repetitive protein
MSLNFKSKIKCPINNLLLAVTLFPISVIFTRLDAFAQTTTLIAAPTIDSSTDSGLLNTDSITSFTSPKIRGACLPGDMVTLYDGRTPLNPRFTCTIARFNIQITNVLTDGVHPITFTRTKGEVTSPHSPVRNITIDTVAPQINVTTTNFVSINNQNIASYPVEGTCTLDSGSVYIPQVLRAPQYSSVPCRSSGTFSAKINFQGVPDGNVTFIASQTDTAGNVSNLYTSPKIIKNTVASPAPGVPSLALGSDNGVSATDNSTTVTTPTFMGACSTGETVQLYINNRLVSARGVGLTSLCTDGTYSITYVAGLALTPGYYRASVAQVNSSGNISSNSNERTFYEDGPTSPTPTTAPELATVSDDGVSNTDDITSEVHPKIQGSCTIGDKISLYDQNHGDVQLFPTARCIGGRYNIVLDAALSEGLHKIYQKSRQLATYCCYNKISAAGPTFDLTIIPLTPSRQNRIK